MIQAFLNNPCKTYRTERFCAFVDHNIVLSVETNGDGSESKTCHDIHTCKKKNQCRYLLFNNLTKINNNSGERNYI